MTWTATEANTKTVWPYAVIWLSMSYLHGALHDTNSHDSILYGYSLSVHESGMSCKLQELEHGYLMKYLYTVFFFNAVSLYTLVLQQKL